MDNITDGQIPVWDGTNGQWLPTTLATSSGGTGTLGCVFDGGGSALVAGTYCDVVVPANCTITAATLLGDQSGSLVCSVWADTYGNYPPTSSDNIAASAPPTLTAATKSRDTTLTGWTTALTAGQAVRFGVTSCSTITQATLTLEVTKS